MSYDCPYCKRHFEVVQARSAHIGAAHGGHDRGALLTEINRLAEQLGHTPTQAEMNSKGEFTETPYQTEFGSWSAAIEEAGIDLRRRQRVDIPTKDLIEEVKRISEEKGRPPTYQEIDDEGKYSHAVFEDRFGSWASALMAAGFEPRTTMYGSSNPSWNGGSVTVTCNTCGASIERVKAETERCERHFCDRECKAEWLSENICGDDNPTWTGGPRDYGSGWSKPKREAVRERDGYECQNPSCDMTQQEHLDEFGRRLHVHHLQPPDTFSNRADANEPENLVTLCCICHMTWEKMAPLRPQPA